MNGMDKAIKVQATINNINKVANATVNAEKKVAKVKEEVAKKEKRLTLRQAGGATAGHVQLFREQQKIIAANTKEREKLAKRSAEEIKKANARSGFDQRLAHLFPALSLKSNAGKTVLAQMMREQDAAEKKIQSDIAKQSQKAIRTANGKANVSERLSHLFPTLAITSAANKTYFAQLMREEEAASNKAALEYDRRRERVLNQRAKQNAARAKRKAKEAAAISRASSAQEAFGIRADFHVQRKEGQFRNYAERFGLKSEQIEAGLIKIREQAAQSRKMYTGANITDLEGFKKDLNMATNALLTHERALRANAVTFASLRSELVQMTAAYSGFVVVQNIAQTGMKMESLRASARVFAKDDQGVADHMTFVANEADRLGVNLIEATQAFTKFSLSTRNKLDKSTQRALFSGVSEYAAVLQLDKESYQRFFRSIQQMSDKGLYAEEVYGF
jgi:hypothetical protein